MITLHYWEPGNGTRYDLALIHFNKDDIILCWFKKSGSGGNCIKLNTGVLLHHTYLAEKMDTNEADTIALLKFLHKHTGVPVAVPFRPCIIPDCHRNSDGVDGKCWDHSEEDCNAAMSYSTITLKEVK
jgi:hypothetical protein